MVKNKITGRSPYEKRLPEIRNSLPVGDPLGDELSLSGEGRVKLVT